MPVKGGPKLGKVVGRKLVYLDIREPSNSLRFEDSYVEMYRINYKEQQQM